MKKLFQLSLVALLTTLATFSFAQTKKDGTPDKRYKASKPAKSTAATTPAATTSHTKKDGTPDKRYAANKTAPTAKAPATTTSPNSE